MSIRIRQMFAAPALLLAIVAHEGRSQDAARPNLAKSAKSDTTTTRLGPPRVEIYGFAMADAIGDANSNDPNWFDVMRPSKLPSTPDQYGKAGHTWLGARQTRIGARASIPTSAGPEIKMVIEWDLFGVGVDAGQTTIRPRHMYGQWGAFGAGQTNSPFMDVDVFPNTIEYWGPNGMLYFRNVQLFWQPINRSNGTRVTFALERPGASADAGTFADRIEMQDVKGRFPAPDLSGEWRIGGGFGYVELAGILRYMAWDDLLADTYDLAGSTMGWGLSLSSGLKLGRSDLLHLQTVYGAGVENYFNDAPIDVGAKLQPGNHVTPFIGKALGDFGMTVYLDHSWNSQFTSSLGYSRVDISNTDGQTATAFRDGQYASANLLWSPVQRVMFGGEFLWGHRDNFGGQNPADDYRLQVSVKYSFSQIFGGN